MLSVIDIRIYGYEQYLLNHILYVIVYSSFPITHSTDRRNNSTNNSDNDKSSTQNNSNNNSRHLSKSSRRSQSMNLKRDKNRDTNRSSVRSTGGVAHQRTLEGRTSSSGGANSAATWETVVLASTAIDPSATGIVRRRSLESIKNAEENKKSYAESKNPSEDQNRLQQAISQTTSPIRSGSEMKEARVVDTPTRSRREGGDKQQRVNKRNERENTTRLLRQASSSHSPTMRQPGEMRRLFFIRHAERVDLTFGHDWFQVYIDDKGYHRRNLNLPRRIPTRRGGPKDFFKDGPISEIGTFQAKLIGEALRAKGVTFTQVYCSPSLRCVQTASSVLEGLMADNAAHLKIKIEPALFEWMAWCRNTLPKFMTVDELYDYGLNVDRAYNPYYSFPQFNLYEKTDEYYYRTHSFVENILRTATGNVLLFGHSATLDVGTRQLTGQPIRKTDDLVRVVQKVPFCGVCVAEETLDAHNNSKWRLAQPPIPSLAHGQNSTFDWRVLETTVNGPPYGKGK